MLSDEAIEEFRKLYKKHYKVEISVEEARRRGQNLVDLFEVVYRPIPKDTKKVVPKRLNQQSKHS